MTVVPERYCREMCMWLMDKLATLQMEDAMHIGQLSVAHVSLDSPDCTGMSQLLSCQGAQHHLA